MALVFFDDVFAVARYAAEIKKGARPYCPISFNSVWAIWNSASVFRFVATHF